MSAHNVWLIVGLAAGLPAAWWMWRRIDVRQLSAIYDSAPPEEPGWTEEIFTDGQLSYGRQGRYDSGLAEMEARVRAAPGGDG